MKESPVGRTKELGAVPFHASGFGNAIDLDHLHYSLLVAGRDFLKGPGVRYKRVFRAGRGNSALCYWDRTSCFEAQADCP